MEEIKQNPANEAEMSELLKIRRDKLNALVAAGKDPYAAVKFDRSAYSTDIKDNYSDYGTRRLALQGA